MVSEQSTRGEEKELLISPWLQLKSWALPLWAVSHRQGDDTRELHQFHNFVQSWVSASEHSNDHFVHLQAERLCRQLPRGGGRWQVQRESLVHAWLCFLMQLELLPHHLSPEQMMVAFDDQ